MVVVECKANGRCSIFVFIISVCMIRARRRIQVQTQWDREAQFSGLWNCNRRQLNCFLFCFLKSEKPTKEKIWGYLEKGSINFKFKGKKAKCLSSLQVSQKATFCRTPSNPSLFAVAEFLLSRICCSGSKKPTTGCHKMLLGNSWH